ALNRYAVNLTVSLLVLTVGLLSLALYFAQHGSRETQWLGIALICEGLPPLIGLAILSSNADLRSPQAAGVVGLQLLTNALWPVFMASICPALRAPLLGAAAVNGLISAAVAFCYFTMWPLPYLFQLLATWIGMAAAVATATALLMQRRGENMT